MDEKERLEEEINNLKEVLIYKERERSGFGLNSMDLTEYNIRVDEEYRYWIDEDIDDLKNHIDRLESDLNSIKEDEVWFGNDGGE
jgi:hypothetical protein